jgi:hypothetical protein
MAKTKVQEFKALEQELAKKAKEIKKHVELVHSIIGKDVSSSDTEIFKVINVEEHFSNDLNRMFVIVEYIEREFKDAQYPEEAYILKSMFDLTEQELRENQEQLKQELEMINQQRRQLFNEVFRVYHVDNNDSPRAFS